MALLGKSLDAVTSPTEGVPIWLDTPKANASLQVVPDGVSSFSVALEGTIDGENWLRITITSNVTGNLIGGACAPFVGLRANAFSVGGGGSISAWVAAA